VLDSHDLINNLHFVDMLMLQKLADFLTRLWGLSVRISPWYSVWENWNPWATSWKSLL